MAGLQRLSERVWIFPFEEERDRPILGYVRGDRWSLVVDAGHSAGHTEDFYKALASADLPLPSLTVLTHWHWDHTFGMHAVNGLCLANDRTNQYIAQIRDTIAFEGRDSFLGYDVKIAREYAGNRPVIITLADMVYTGSMMLDAGNCPARVFESEAPHTDDSTLVYVPGEKILFLGDAAYGEFPTWTSDPEKCRKLVESISPLDADLCVKSHHEPVTKNEALRDLGGW